MSDVLIPLFPDLGAVFDIHGSTRVVSSR
jgi:hypothetical protein